MVWVQVGILGSASELDEYEQDGCDEDWFEPPVGAVGAHFGGVDVVFSLGYGGVDLGWVECFAFDEVGDLLVGDCAGGFEFGSDVSVVGFICTWIVLVS